MTVTTVQTIEISIKYSGHIEQQPCRPSKTRQIFLTIEDDNKHGGYKQQWRQGSNQDGGQWPKVLIFKLIKLFAGSFVCVFWATLFIYFHTFLTIALVLVNLAIFPLTVKKKKPSKMSNLWVVVAIFK